MTLNPETLETFRADSEPSRRAIRAAGEAVAASRLGHPLAVVSVRGYGRRGVVVDDIAAAIAGRLSRDELVAELVCRLAGDIAIDRLTSKGVTAAERADVAARHERLAELEKRAADMAATFGGPTSQAVESISALLRGERDVVALLAQRLAGDPREPLAEAALEQFRPTAELLVDQWLAQISELAQVLNDAAVLDGDAAAAIIAGGAG